MRTVNFALLLLAVLFLALAVEHDEVACERAELLHRSYLELSEVKLAAAAAGQVVAVRGPEHFGPFMFRWEALDQAKALRERGFRCEVKDEGPFRWYVIATRR